MRLHLGKVVATPATLKLLQEHNLQLWPYLYRHAHGDWGEVPSEDAEANNAAVDEGSRVISSYKVGEGKIWIITESDRSVTTLLLPEEY